MNQLLKKTIRLAYSTPVLRPKLLPLIKQASEEGYEVASLYFHVNNGGFSMAVRDTGWGPELEAGASHFGAVESSVKCKVTRENLTQAAEMFYEASMHEGYSQEELSAKPSSKMTAYGLFGYQVMVLGPLDETGQYIEKPSSLVITEMSQDQAEAQPKTHYKAQAFFVHLGNTFMTAEGPTELEAKTKLVSKVSAKIRSFLEKPSPEGKTAFGWVPVG